MLDFLNRISALRSNDEWLLHTRLFNQSSNNRPWPFAGQKCKQSALRCFKIGPLNYTKSQPSWHFRGRNQIQDIVLVVTLEFRAISDQDNQSKMTIVWRNKEGWPDELWVTFVCKYQTWMGINGWIDSYSVRRDLRTSNSWAYDQTTDFTISKRTME